MKYYFEQAFYAPELGNAPEGAVEISDERWFELLDAQARGKRIVTGSDGFPIAADPEEPSLDELKAVVIETLWRNYKTHQTKYVDAEDLYLAGKCAQEGSSMGSAVEAWVMSLWARYYDVRDMLVAAETVEALDSIDLSADACGEPPYTIRQLNDEARAASVQNTNAKS